MEIYVREIDFLDMFWEWVSHWKSLLLLIILFILTGEIMFYFSHKVEPVDMSISNNNEGVVVTNLPGNLRVPVENLANNYKKCEELKKEYYEKGDTFSLAEKSEILFNIIACEQLIEKLKRNNMTELQLEYYSSLIGTNYNNVVHTDTNNKTNKTKLVLAVLGLIFIHGMFFGFVFIFDPKLKKSDDLPSLLGCIEYSKCIDWDSIDRKKGIDKLILKCGFFNEKRVELSKTEQINSNMIVEVASKLGLNTIAIICGDFDELAQNLKGVIDREGKGLTVKVVESLVYDADGVKLMSDVEGAVIISKINQSKVIDLKKEANALKNRSIKLLGAVEYMQA